MSGFWQRKMKGVCVETCCQSLPCFTACPLCTVIRAVDSDVMTWGETTAGKGELGERERQSVEGHVYSRHGYDIEVCTHHCKTISPPTLFLLKVAVQEHLLWQAPDKSDDIQAAYCVSALALWTMHSLTVGEKKPRLFFLHLQSCQHQGIHSHNLIYLFMHACIPLSSISPLACPIPICS